MNFLTVTYGLLLVLVLFSYTQLAEHKQTILAVSSQNAYAKTVQDDLSQNTLEKIETEFKKIVPDDKTEEDTPATKQFRTPSVQTERLSKFLDISALFEGTEGMEETPRKKGGYILLKTLIGTLFSNTDFFKEAQERDSNSIEAFLLDFIDCTKQYKKKFPKFTISKNTRPETLGKIPLDNEEFQYLRYKMMQGSKKTPTTRKHSSNEGYYSLLDFIRVSGRNEGALMCVYAAPRDLLFALFQENTIVDEVIKQRIEIAKKFKNLSQSEKDILQNEFEMNFKPLIADGINHALISFKISTTAPPIY